MIFRHFNNRLRSGNLSLNSLICLNLLVVLIVSSMVAYQNLINYNKNNILLTEYYYDSSICSMCVQINYLYSIKDAYEKTNSADKFDIYFAEINRPGHTNASKKKFYKDDRVSFFVIAGNEPIKKVGPSIEFSAFCNYKVAPDYKKLPKKIFDVNGDFIRLGNCRRCQITNPYIKYNIKNPDEKRPLTNEEIKSLFKYTD